MQHSLPEAHELALLRAQAIVEGIAGNQMNAVTPCDGWLVRDLLNHVVAENWWVAPLMEGQTIEEVGDVFNGDILGAYPMMAYEQSAKSAAESFFMEDALTRPVALSYGSVTGAAYCSQRIIDILIHGWDLAKATGQETRIDPQQVEDCWEIVEPQQDQLHASGLFGTPVVVSEGAPLQTRLLATLGRAE